MFLFHGRRDRNRPFAERERLVRAFRQSGARVAFHVEEDKEDQETFRATFAA